MDANTKSKCCCCAPYPTIDLTPAFAFKVGKNDMNCPPEEQRLDALKNKVTEACAQYGCFHVTIAHSALGEEYRHIKELADVTHVKKSIQHLFDEEFISSAVHVHENANVASSVAFRNGEGGVQSAKYRGRAAESGSTSGLEPKQSWEFFRCHSMLDAAPLDTSTSTRTLQEDAGRLAILNDYIRILHEVAVRLFSPHVLDLPQRTFIEDRECACACAHDNGQDCFCTMDLLRVFRYDALSDRQQIDINLGSSPHTDWGSLTVVWQDSKGGLQIYCHEHERWNDVEAQSDDADDDEEKLVRLFIHVGDFTSLSMSRGSAASTPSSSSPSSQPSERVVTWPSPLHRVLCPHKMTDGDDATGDDARCSLVYFAYPPRGVSLHNAQFQLSLASKQKQTHSDCPNPNPHNAHVDTKGSFPYDRFMVLNNQSLDAVETSREEEVYHRIVKVPFDVVIQQKWNEVQR